MLNFFSGFVYFCRGSGMPKSRQIFIARRRSISLCRGTVELRRVTRIPENAMLATLADKDATVSDNMPNK